MKPLHEAAVHLALGEGASDDFPDLAVRALESGQDSPTLRRLAGLASNDRSDARRQLELALAELGIPIPPLVDAILIRARQIAAEILAARVTPYDGASAIWRLELKDPHGLEHRLDAFVYAASEWEDRPADRPRFEDAIRSAALRLVG